MPLAKDAPTVSHISFSLCRGLCMLWRVERADGPMAAIQQAKGRWIGYNPQRWTM